MFDCCRVPGIGGKDWSVTYAKAGDTGDSGHVVLIRKGRFWRLDPFKDGKLLSSQDLERYNGGSFLRFWQELTPLQANSTHLG